MVQKLNGLFLVVFDVNVFVLLVEMVNLCGIKVVIFDLGINLDILVSFVVINNCKVGVQVVDVLVLQVNNKGKVGIIVYVVGIFFVIECLEGFMECMKEKYFDIKVLFVQYSDGDL